MTAFTHIVSLGHRCRTAQRLRDHFGYKTAFPFDWWITPLAGGTAFLRDWDLERLYDPSQLRRPLRPSGRTPYIEHADYRVRLQHEFPLDGPNGNVLDGWQDHIAQAKERTGHLMEKFDQLNRPDRKVLFVRELRKEEEGDLRGVAALREAALTRVPRAEVSFLLISRIGMEAKGWRALKINDPITEPWTGTPAIWDAALETLGYSFERREGWGEVEKV